MFWRSAGPPRYRLTWPNREVSDVSNVDFVVVEGGPSLDDVTAAVIAVTGAFPRGEYLGLEDDRAGFRVVQQAERIIIRVYYAGDVEPRQALSLRIYDALVESTDWNLTLDSDDAEDIIATRINAEVTHQE